MTAYPFAVVTGAVAMPAAGRVGSGAVAGVGAAGHTGRCTVSGAINRSASTTGAA